MTPHPSQEYIITEQTVLMLEQECFKSGNTPDKDNCENCPYEPKSGPRKGCCNFDKWEVLKIIRSRPHTRAPGEPAIRADERKKVLDLIDAIALEGMKRKEESLGEKYCKERPQQVDSCWHRFHKIVEALRQQGGEQG